MSVALQSATGYPDLTLPRVVSKICTCKRYRDYLDYAKLAQSCKLRYLDIDR